MAMQIELNGETKTVTKEEIYELAKNGQIQPDTVITVDGADGTKKYKASQMNEIVFGNYTLEPYPTEPKSESAAPEEIFGLASSAPPVQAAAANETQWYYSQNGVQQGPVPESTIIQYINSRTINADTMMYRNGMSNWARLADTELTLQLPQGIAVPLRKPQQPPQPRQATQMPVQQQYPAVPEDSEAILKKLNNYFMFFWISLATCVIPILGVLGMISAIVFNCLFHYTIWTQIPPSIAKTTPGKAVGFRFIPFFCFYWWFVAFWDLGKNMNQALEERGSNYRVNTTLALIMCVLNCSCGLFIFAPIFIIPVIGQILMVLSLLIMIPSNIAMWVINIIYFLQLKQAANELLSR